MMLLGLILALSGPAHAGGFFDRYPIASSLSSCHAPDYESYHQARNLRASIEAEKPDFKKPNFAGKYLILKASLMMETLWFIMDCETGKFYHSKLEGEALFQETSLLLELRSKKESRYELWSGEDWTEVQVTSPTTQSPTLAFPPTTPKGSAAGNTVEACKTPDFSSYFRAQAGEMNLRKLNPDLAHSNFNGHYLILKNELVFETLWLIADCLSGKFEPVYLSGKSAQFSPESDSVVIRESGEFPRHFRWTSRQWVELPDLSRVGHGSVKNTWKGSPLAALFKALPNPEHHSRLDFKDWTCIVKPAPEAPACELSLESPSGKVVQVTLSAAVGQELLPLIQSVGVSTPGSKNLRIEAGTCLLEKETCTFETR